MYGGPNRAALTPAKDIKRFHQDIWTTDQGLPQNTVLSILKSHDGYLTMAIYGSAPGWAWCGSTACVSPDRDGSLWIGTVGAGLSRLVGAAFSSYSTKDGLSS